MKDPPLPVVVVAALLLFACRPDLPEPSGAGGRGGPTGPEVRSDPGGAPLEAPAIGWLLVDAPGVSLTPEDVVLVEGTLGSASLEQLARGAPSDALLERVVPTTRWRDGAALVVAPHRALVPDAEHAVALLPLRTSLPVRTASEPPPLRATFPEAGRAGRVRVVCGSEPWPPLSLDLALAPEGPAARLERGSPRGAAQACAVLSPSGEGGPWHMPPAIRAGGGIHALEPTPFVVASMPAPGPLECGADELAFGLGCASVSDDRAIVRTPEEPLFWAISGAVDAAFTSSGEVVVVRGLEPERTQSLSVEVLDEGGRWTTHDLSVRTLPPRAHLVINEVYADAVGPEPAQEWVELVNDGRAPGSLDGYALLDPGGRTDLPALVVPPGAHVLVVGEDFDADAPWDPPLPSGVPLARVARVGKSGLSNQGEPLLLEAPDGSLESAFAPSPSPRPGISVARRRPSSPDHDPESFARAVLGPTPGAPNEGSFGD